MKAPALRRRVLAVALIALTATTAAVPAVAFAQDEEKEDKATEISSRAGSASQRARERAERRAERAGKASTQAAAATPTKYPNATRSVAVGKATPNGGKLLRAMLDLFEAGKAEEARSAAEAIIASGSMNPYERAFAARTAMQIAIDAEDFAAALKFADQAVQFNALSNDDHFDLIAIKAQIQLRQQDYAGVLSTMDHLISETKSDKPEHLVLKGNALYRLGKFADAVAVLRPAASALSGRDDVQQLFADALARSGNNEEAARLAEQVASKNPKDKRAQLNLVQSYLRSKQDAKAIELLEQLRTSGQLSDDQDYRQLFTIYANATGKEKETAEVINEGLSKGILKADFNVYLALAQSLYYSEQIEPAIEAYNKAAPLAKDGEVWLNLARVYWNEQRISEAKQAAQQAINKGLKNPGEAKKILALPGK